MRMKRNGFSILIPLVLVLILGGCGKKATAAEPTPAPAAEAEASAEMSDPAAEAAASPEMPAPQTPASRDPASGEASGAPAMEPAMPPEPATESMPTAAPEPTPEPASLPLVPGVFTGSDGSVLTVEADGTCTYEATVTGTINNVPAEGRLTFCGTLEDGVFSFTKVMYYGLDVTEIGRASGYSDYSRWEQAAALIYAGGIG